jgi:hypothetical protein
MDSVAIVGAPLRFTCCGLNAMVYPGIFGCERRDSVTVLGTRLTGAIVICIDPGCPATAVRVAPLVGPIVKSGMFTFTRADPAEANSKFVSPGYVAEKYPNPCGTVVAVTVSIWFPLPSVPGVLLALVNTEASPVKLN